MPASIPAAELILARWGEANRLRRVPTPAPGPGEPIGIAV